MHYLCGAGIRPAPLFNMLLTTCYKFVGFFVCVFNSHYRHNFVSIHIIYTLILTIMLAVNFKPIAGNCAPVKQASETETKHASDVASSLISKLQEIAVLSEDENQLLDFVKTVNSDLTCKFAGCSDSEKAAKQFTHYAIVGEKKIYSIATAPKSLDDLLMNLASTRTLFRAVKIETAKSDKAAENETFETFVGRKQLPSEMLLIAGVRESLVSQWFEYLRNLQVSEGSIRDLCTASGIEYQQTETETETESTATESTATERKQSKNTNKKSR